MNKTIGNILIMALFTAGGGWLGIWLNSITENTSPPMESLGALVWLVSPLLAGVLLRIFGGDGWKDFGLSLNLPAGGRWYLVAVFVYPLVALLGFGLSLALGAISAEGFTTQGFGAYATAVGVMLAGSLIKNIFEEFAWRGYLTPRLDAAKVPPLLNHLIVAVLWWSWHLPYYYYFLDKTVLQGFLQTSLPVFILIALIGLLPTSILFGELRLASKSVWPAFILHNMINALSMPLIISGFIKLNGTMGVIFTPTNEGIVSSFLLGVAGLLIYQYRTKKQVH